MRHLKCGELRPDGPQVAQRSPGLHLPGLLQSPCAACSRADRRYSRLRCGCHSIFSIRLRCVGRSVPASPLPGPGRLLPITSSFWLRHLRWHVCWHATATLDHAAARLHSVQQWRFLRMQTSFAERKSHRPSAPIALMDLPGRAIEAPCALCQVIRKCIWRNIVAQSWHTFT